MIINSKTNQVFLGSSLPKSLIQLESITSNNQLSFYKES